MLLNRPQAGVRPIAEAVFAGLLAPREHNRRLRALRGTPYHQLLSGTGDRVAQENGLDRAFWAGCAKLYRADPLGIDVVIGYLWQQYYELVNLRLLARAKWYGLPSPAVRQQLFLA
jgi:vacuolar-type H+-ATPase subunit C/Vma6